MQVEGHRGQQCLAATGGRVRNAYATCPLPGDSPGKPGLIPHGTLPRHRGGVKGLPVGDGHACH